MLGSLLLVGRGGKKDKSGYINGVFSLTPLFLSVLKIGEIEANIKMIRLPIKTNFNLILIGTLVYF